MTEYSTSVLADLSGFLLDLSDQEKRELVARTAEIRHTKWCIAKICGEPCQGPKPADLELARNILSELTKLPEPEDEGGVE